MHIDGNAEAVILGNSQYEELDRFQYSIPVQELGLAGTGYAIQAAVFLEHVKSLPHIKLLMIGFCNIPLRMQDIHNRNGDLEDVTAWGVPWHKLPLTSWVDRLNIGLLQLPVIGILITGPNLSVTTSDVNADKQSSTSKDKSALLPSNTSILPSTHFRLRGFKSEPANGKKKQSEYVKHLSDERQLASNRDAFLGIIEYCNSNGIDVALLRSPTTQAFWQSYSDSWKNELHELYREVLKRSSHIQVFIWDAEHKLQMPDHWFKDGNHMAEPALQQYAEYLSGMIGNWKSKLPQDDGIQSVLNPIRPDSFHIRQFTFNDVKQWITDANIKSTDTTVPPQLLRFSKDAQLVSLPAKSAILFKDASAPQHSSALQALTWIWNPKPGVASVNLSFEMLDMHMDLVNRKHLRFIIDEPVLTSTTRIWGAPIESPSIRLVNNGNNSIEIGFTSPQMISFERASK